MKGEIPAAATLVDGAADSLCPNLEEALEGLRKIQDEQGVPGVVDYANAVIDGLTNEACKKGVMTLKQLIATTQATPKIQPVARGQDLLVTVVRQRTDKEPAKKWTITYHGRSRGEWLTTYGFSFLTDWPWGSLSQSFTAEETATQGQYVIEQDVTQEHLRFVPTVFFTWVPSPSNISRNASLAFSGGLGFDFSNPVVTVGLAWVWNRNLTLHAGAAATRVDRLLGRYAVGDIVSTNLTPSQLTTSAYRVNPMVSLSFNFSSNPFTSGTAAQSKAEDKPAAPKPPE
jgi:hypothetical protein